MSFLSSPSERTPGTHRNIELVLLLIALAITAVAYATVNVTIDGHVSEMMWPIMGGMTLLVLLVHAVVRWQVPYADPLILPIVTLLNGLGLVMIWRIDLAVWINSGARYIPQGTKFDPFSADLRSQYMTSQGSRQLLWTFIAVSVAVALIVWMRDHRRLRRYTFTYALVGLLLLLAPLLPFLGRTINGSRIWVGIGSLSFQPSEVAKICLTVFFAAYLIQTRDALSLVGRKFLGFPLPRARDLGPIMVAWLASVAVLVFEHDLGTSLLFFGLFVAMLYVATERRAWIAIGLLLFLAAALVAWQLFANFQNRVSLWLDPFPPPGSELSDQVGRSLMGMASGGLFGRGLGRGYPTLNYEQASSDFIISVFGEELGLVGFTAIVCLFAILVQRGLRASLATRDGFGKLLAVGLSFSLGLQVFVVIGGLTRVIPMTGLTTPFMAAGGSSLLANWAIVAFLLRISDQARRPLAAPVVAPAVTGVSA